MTAIVTTILSVLTLLGGIAVLTAIPVYIGYCTNTKARKFFTPLLKFFDRFALYFSLIVALTATVGSLFFSEYAGYNPCKLCWYQRIFMYPQVILLSIAFLRRDRLIRPYIIALSAIGALIALDHYLLQVANTTIIPCSTIGISESCSEKFIMHFGYITIPMMSLTAFLLIFLLMLNTIIVGKNKKLT